MIVNVVAQVLVQGKVEQSRAGQKRQVASYRPPFEHHRGGITLMRERGRRHAVDGGSG